MRTSFQGMGSELYQPFGSPGRARNRRVVNLDSLKIIHGKETKEIEQVKKLAE